MAVDYFSLTDTITDFVVADDTIRLEQDFLVFEELNRGIVNKAYFRIGESAADFNDYLIYTKATGELFYDWDGNDSSPKVQIAKLDANLNLTNADFFVV